MKLTIKTSRLTISDIKNVLTYLLTIFSVHITLPVSFNSVCHTFTDPLF